MKPINEQINPEMVIQAQKLAKFTHLLHNILPIECRNHVAVANIRNQNLMLITDSPVWTTRLRQLSPQILQYIQENSTDTDTGSGNNQVIHHVQIRTRYSPAGAEALHASKTARKPAPRISEKTAELLSQSANSIDNEKLKTSLLKMARHVDSSIPTRNKR
ncbi:hypothetical protein MNBD_GAMMA05-2495 [hydrothermal vent metagenome]|uniref:Zn-ribbon-containing, possibly RNA-binding protein and truncated derivatives n=1 Tax=hydrothermal vent metagenome TaxID=652676 RepID=A0A3B0WXP2_9ZZZZ